MKPMLAKTLEGQNVTGWLMSEKLDGVRAIWNGKQLVSRNGKTFAAPAWFLAALPQGETLDGELYMGRSQFQSTVSAVRRKTPTDAEWRQMRYCTFDAPEAVGGFEERLSACRKAVSGSAVAEVVEHRECLGPDDFEEYLADLCLIGAEGVMFREPGSAYESKRSSSLLKFKLSDDDEAVVIGTEDGEGKSAGMVGALVVKWCGKTFSVGAGLTNALRTRPPKTGAVITFGFCGLTDGGIPRFPTFLAERSYE